VNRIFRILTAMIIVSTLGISLSYAETIWERRQKALQAGAGPQAEKQAPKQTPELAKEEAMVREDTEETIEELDLLDQLSITIPDQYGTVIETHKGSNGKLIVYIQDAHANYEAQRNLAYILESVIEDTGLELVFREGMSTNKDLNSLRNYGSDEARREAAEDLLESAEITGEEYLELTSTYPLSFYGLEEKALYEEQKNMLWEVDKIRDIGADYVGRLMAAAEALKPHIYTEELLELSNKKKDYDDGNIDLLAYYQYLYAKSEANDAPLYVFPNLSNLIQIGELEKEIDMAAISAGNATDEEMESYDKYTRLMKDLNINELFKEEPQLEDFLIGVLATNPDQKQLVRISRALSIMKNLLEIKVVPEEYKYFIDNKKDFNPLLWSDFIIKKSEELRLDTDVPENAYVISDNLPVVEKFYSVAFKRDTAFVTRLDEELKGHDENIAGLIAGGFHAPALTELLADKGYSYLVVSPRVTTVTDESLYRATFIR